MRRGLDGIYLPFLACVQFSSLAGALVPLDFGGHSEGETPLPIPNRAVKPLSADGTWWATAWESRSPPVFHSRAAFGRLFVVPATSSDRRRRGSSPVKTACPESATRDGPRRGGHRDELSHR